MGMLEAIFIKLRLKSIVLFSRFHSAVLLLSKGKLMHTLQGLEMVLLITKGRHTGVFRNTPLLYVRQAETFYCAASFAGSHNNPEWLLNLIADPNVTLITKQGHITATACVVSGPERSQSWHQLVEYYPPFAKYQERTHRIIPVVRFDVSEGSTNISNT